MDTNTTPLLLQKKTTKRWNIKPAHVKYYGSVVVFFMMIAAIKVFVNYATIQTSIYNVGKETEEILRHQSYLSLQTYVYNLPSARVFIAHDNSILLPGERVMTDVDLPALSGNVVIFSGQTTQAGGFTSGETYTQSIQHIQQNSNRGEVTTGNQESEATDMALVFYKSLPKRKSWVLYFAQKMH